MPKDELAGGARLGAAFAGPAQGAFDGGAQFARRAGVRRAIVEDHRDVGAERFWMAMASLGPRKSGEPSRCERNSTPWAWILRMVARLKT